MNKKMIKILIILVVVIVLVSLLGLKKEAVVIDSATGNKVGGSYHVWQKGFWKN